MADGEGGERLWLRPLGLFFLAMALAVGQPLIVAGLAFALLAFVVPGRGAAGLFLGAAVVALVFAGEPASGFWYLERGWAILVAGWFVAGSLAWPDRPFFTRALVGVGGGTAAAAAVLLAVDGWPSLTWLVDGRIEASAAATSELVRLVAGGTQDQVLIEALERTAEMQSLLFPALLGLGTLAALGVGWWGWVRISTGSGAGLGPLRSFRFPDALVWVLIGGILLLLVAGWSAGWGRMGANLVVFMAGLYALRGAAVLIFLAGGISFLGGLLVALGLVFAAPILLAAAAAVGVGDSWLDLRSRRTEA